MRRPYGLRPRLLAALVLTSAVTLLAAALTLFGPLQDRLRRDQARSLENAVVASRLAVERGFPGNLTDANNLARSTAARVNLYDVVGREKYDSATGPFEPTP